MSAYEWRNPRGALNVWGEKISDAPVNLLRRGSLTTDSAKRLVWETGTPATALILSRPKARTATGGPAEGRFRVRVTAADGTSHETDTRQTYAGWEWDLLGEGATVECRVLGRRVLLCAPEPG